MCVCVDTRAFVRSFHKGKAQMIDTSLCAHSQCVILLNTFCYGQWIANSREHTKKESTIKSEPYQQIELKKKIKNEMNNKQNIVTNCQMSRHYRKL